MIGYVLKEKQHTMGLFCASWEELLEVLADIGEPKTGFIIDTCNYYETDFKEKSDE